MPTLLHYLDSFGTTSTADCVERVQVTAAQGLANQHSVLLSLLTLGMAAGVDRILLPPHMHRSAFTSTAQWEAGPTEALWDVESIGAHVRKAGIELQVSVQECAESLLASFNGSIDCRLQQMYWCTPVVILLHPHPEPVIMPVFVPVEGPA